MQEWTEPHEFFEWIKTLKDDGKGGYLYEASVHILMPVQFATEKSDMIEALVKASIPCAIEVSCVGRFVPKDE